MSELKRFEITVEATAFDGSQVFACMADSELEARLKYSRGECEIIEHTVEVLGLGEIMCVDESNCIASRLPQDIESKQAERIKELEEVIEASLRVKNLWLPVGAFSDCPPENYREIEALHIMHNKLKEALNK